MVPFYQLRTPRVARVKRFLERWVADETFRKELDVSPAQAVAGRGFDVEPDEIRPLWDSENREELDRAFARGEVPASSPVVTEYLTFRRAKLDHASLIREESAPRDPRFRAWRARQIARTSTELHPHLHEAIAHLTFACELGKGCTVGCWFCGVSAEPFSGNFLHNPENSRLWAATLDALRHFVGPRAGRWGFLYWGTDPLDNPDYERFCEDFCRTFGAFPHTTTAQPLKDAARTRRLIRRAEESGCYHNRFSVLSLRMLDRVHREFSPEELTLVELVMHTRGALMTRFNAGKARGTGRLKEWFGQTISCVSGFLINMVERTVRLVSPCAATDRWPSGYITFDEASFTDADELKEIMGRMVGSWMPVSYPLERRPHFRRDLAFKPLPRGFSVSSRFATITFDDNSYFADLGELIHAGAESGEAIVRHFASRHDVEPSIAHGWIDQLFESGILDEEPESHG